MVGFEQVRERIRENGLRHERLALQDGAFVVVLEHGGRILGPFLAEDEASIFWLNDAWRDADAFAAFVAAGKWNLGGERVWIAPEIQYSVRDRTDFWGTVACSPEMDPGHYTLENSPGGCALHQTCTLQAHNLASGSKQLTIQRTIRPVANPLQALGGFDELMQDVVYAGYEHAVTISETRHDDMLSEGWSLIQLNSGGDVLMPASPEIEVVDYFTPVDAAHQVIDRDSGAVRVKISGRRQFKVGYKACHLYGRLGYVNNLHDGRWYLLVRNFFNNPSARYAEEPPHLPGCHGHSVHVYNDDGSLGGFGELEVMGQTIGGRTGRSASSDQFLLWLFVGPEASVQRLARHVLGISV
jgi:hypothetical protein